MLRPYLFGGAHGFRGCGYALSLSPQLTDYGEVYTWAIENGDGKAMRYMDEDKLARWENQGGFTGRCLRTILAEAGVDHTRLTFDYR